MIGALLIGSCFSLWAVTHSLLAGAGTKERVYSRWGARVGRWYRLGYVLWATVSLGPLVVLMFTLTASVLYSVTAPWRYVMNGLQAVSLVLGGISIAVTHPGSFIGISPEKASGESHLRTNGIYGLIRHPMYLFSIIIMWLSPKMTVNTAVLFCLMSLYFVVGSIHEERMLMVEFGEKYRDYMQLVPRIIPNPKSIRRALTRQPR